MPAVFAAEDIERLLAPHVTRAWFARLELPSGELFLHSGVGRVVLDGVTWLGLGDPVGARLLSLGTIEEPRFGSAAAMAVVLTGVDVDFFRSVWTNRDAIEGSVAEVWWQTWDMETATPIGPKVKIFPRGRITAPKIIRERLGVRSIGLSIVSIWESKNFAPGGRWTPADQHRRFPGDKGLDFVGVEITEQWA